MDPKTMINHDDQQDEVFGESAQEIVFRQAMLFSKIMSYIPHEGLKSVRLVNSTWLRDSSKQFFSSNIWINLPSYIHKRKINLNCNSDLSTYLTSFGKFEQKECSRFILDLYGHTISKFHNWKMGLCQDQLLLKFLAKVEKITNIRLIINIPAPEAWSFLKLFLSKLPPSTKSVALMLENWRYSKFEVDTAVDFSGIALNVKELEIELYGRSVECTAINRPLEDDLEQRRLQLHRIMLAFPNIVELGYRIDCCDNHGAELLQAQFKNWPAEFANIHTFNLTVAGGVNINAIAQKLLLLPIPLKKLTLRQPWLIFEPGQEVQLTQILAKFAPQLEQLEIGVSKWQGVLPASPKLKVLKVSSWIPWPEELTPIITSLHKQDKFQTDFTSLERLEVSIVFSTERPEQEQRLRNVLDQYYPRNCEGSVGFPKKKIVRVFSMMANRPELKAEYPSVIFCELLRNHQYFI